MKLEDAEILSMGIVKAYAPPNTSMDLPVVSDDDDNNDDATSKLQAFYDKEAHQAEGVDLIEQVVTLGQFAWCR